jgi:CBS domain-containing protein/sporulation protein YlmC with PRC-barrel domain
MRERFAEVSSGIAGAALATTSPRQEGIMATNEPRAILVRLSDTNLTLAEQAEDVRGLKVLDVAGEELGTVNDLFIDEAERKVRFLEVSSGGFLGLGATKFLLPVDAITRITADVVYINQSRERVAGAPQYDPNLVEERYARDVYGHYGYAPYWGADYHYPPYPYYASANRPSAGTEEDRDYRAKPAPAGVTSGLYYADITGVKVKDIMTRDVEVIHPEATLWESAQKMAALDVGPLPVCSGDQLVGMLTDRDITVRATAQGRDPKTTRVHEVMTPEVVYVFEDDDISEAARIMMEQQVRRLVVLNQSKQLVGIISLGDLAVHTGDAQQAGQTLEGVSEPSEPLR